MKPTKTIGMETLNALPIFRNYNESQIAKADPTALRPGSVPVFNILKWTVITGLIGAFCFIALPIIFKMVAYTIAVVIVCVLTFVFIMFVPTLFRWVKSLVRAFEKKRIDSFAFDELDRKKTEYIDSRNKFSKGKADCESITVDLQNESKRNELKVVEYREEIVKMLGKSDKVKADIDTNLAKFGVDYKTEDDYVKKTVQYSKLLTDAERLGYSLKQSESFVSKFGSRAAALKKICHRFEFVQLALDNKVLDLDATIELLKNEYNIAKKLNNATATAESVLGFTEDWQFEYALESINATIANDLSSTVSSLSNIDAMTKGFVLDNDEMYANLESLANSITTGSRVVPNSAAYKNPDYKFTAEDKLNGGGFGSLMQ